MTANHYTYRVTWSPDDGEYAATAAEFPSLSWLDPDPSAALAGLIRMIGDASEDVAEAGEVPPPSRML